MILHNVSNFSPQIVLAFGNYMNSSKRGAAYGFRLQSLDLVSSHCFVLFLLYFKNFDGQINLVNTLHFQLLETKSTDRSQTLLHFITSIIQEKYSDLANFHTDLHFVDKAALGTHTHKVSLSNYYGLWSLWRNQEYY